MNGLSLFANVGIAEAYLKDVGIDIVVANELLAERCRFYSHLYPECNMIQGSICDKIISDEIILQSKKENVEFVIATPPCQGMSIAGDMNPYDERNSLIKYAIDVIQLFNMYSSLSTAISSVYLPSISRSVFKGESDDEVTERIIEPSRIQLTILLLALTGFFLFGKAFINVWVGAEYIEVYLLCCVLLTTSTLELSQNTITAILKAKNMLHGKTLILAGSTVVNIILTFVLVPRLGTLGAAIGTAFSLVFGYGLALNLYYHFKIHVNMKTYYKKTYRGILPAAIIACLIGIPMSLFIKLGGWAGFVVKAFVYVAIYAAVVYLIGFNKQEKQLLKKLFKKLSRKKAL